MLVCIAHKVFLRNSLKSIKTWKENVIFHCSNINITHPLHPDASLQCHWNVLEQHGTWIVSRFEWNDCCYSMALHLHATRIRNDTWNREMFTKSSQILDSNIVSKYFESHLLMHLYSQAISVITSFSGWNVRNALTLAHYESSARLNRRTTTILFNYHSVYNSHLSNLLSSTFQYAFGSRIFGLHETSCCSKPHFGNCFPLVVSAQFCK